MILLVHFLKYWLNLSAIPILKIMANNDPIIGVSLTVSLAGFL